MKAPYLAALALILSPTFAMADPYTAPPQNHTIRDAAIGAGLGAVVGAAASNHNRGTHALEGAALGGAAGGLVGHTYAVHNGTASPVLHSATTRDAAIGVGVGALAGAVVSKHHRGQDALIGAALGGGAGALYGHTTQPQQ